jgi:hypothetical protein
LRTVIEVVCRILRLLIPALVAAALPVASRVDAAEPPAPATQGDEAGAVSGVQGALSGAEAFVTLVLDGELAEVAAGVDWTAGELGTTLLTDDTLFVTDDGDVGYADEAPGTGEFTTTEPPPAHADASSVLHLHSQPAAPLTILLDVDGHLTKNTGWNSKHAEQIVSAPFDRDGNPGSLTPSEIAEIEAVWQIVAEDFAPFDVDVTTEDPGTDALRYSGSHDDEYGTRIVITPTDKWPGADFSNSGGVAFVGLFESNNTPAFVFSSNLFSYKTVGDASSHESGHTLGLRHDGAPSTDYYNGHGEWGPIMGSSYSRALAQWSKGEYAGADRANEDDLEKMAGYLGYHFDDHGDTTPTATHFTGSGETSGFVGANDPVDVFTVDVFASGIDVRLTPSSSVSNLFASVTIRNAEGAVVATDTPTAVLAAGSMAHGVDWAAHAAAVVPDGRYTVEVRPAGLGTPSTGFSAYGSHGAYRLAVTVGAEYPPPAPALPGQVRLTPMQPARLADTRSGLGGSGRLGADGVLVVHVAGNADVPDDVTAAALNVTAVGPTSGGFLTVYPCSDTVPTTSTVNFAAGRDIANSTIATLDVDGDVCVYSSTATDVIVDISAWFSSGAAAGMSASESRRVADTRSGLGGSLRLAAGSVLTVATGDVGASAVALNVTAIGASEAGFLTVYPCATTPPVASNVNFGAGEVRPNNTIVAVAPGGLVCVYSSAAVDVVIDVTAAFSASGQFEYLPATPHRLIDTRETGVIAAGGEIAFAVPSPGATPDAVSVNVTATGHDTDGYTTTFGCGTVLPEASTLNQRVGESNANGAIVPVGAGATGCVFTSSATNLIVDLNGWWVPAG